MNPLTWQNPGQLFVAQDIIKVKKYSVAELRIELLFEVKLNFYMQFKSRDVAHEGSTMKIDYNTRFLLAVRRKRKIIGYFIGHSEATARDGFHLSKHHATFA